MPSADSFGVVSVCAFCTLAPYCIGISLAGASCDLLGFLCCTLCSACSTYPGTRASTIFFDSPILGQFQHISCLPNQQLFCSIVLAPFSNALRVLFQHFLHQSHPLPM